MGILGGFSGTVGTVVGSSNRKGEDIIRVKSKKPQTSNSEAQLNQRSKFSLVTMNLQSLNFLLKIGLKKVAGDQMSPYNYACQFALKKAITGEAPNFEMDYSHIKLSEGNLGQAKSAAAELNADKVSFQWEDISANSVGQSTDKAILLVYNVNNFELSYSIGEETRESASALLPIPNGEIGDTLAIYLFFQSATDPTLVSTSQYLGSLTMV